MPLQDRNRRACGRSLPVGWIGNFGHNRCFEWMLHERLQSFSINALPRATR
jgi:hypothetical protein